MRSSDIRVGFIGCGNMGKLHMEGLRGAGVQLVSCYDANSDAAEAAAREFGVNAVVDDARQLFDDEGIHAIVVATHHDTHRPYAVAAMEAGKDVFVEKPLAITHADVDAIEAAVASTGRKLMCGFQIRYSPFLQKLREVIGTPLALHGALTDPRWGDAIWANDPVRGGGNVLSQGCHLFDGVCFFADSEPVNVYAEGGNLQHPEIPGITDSVVATIRFANGVVASIVCGDYGANPALGKASYQLYAGTKVGALMKYYNAPELHFWGVEPNQITMADLLPTGMAEPADGDWKSASYRWLHGYPQQLQAFLDWICTDTPPPDIATVHEAARATRIGLTMIESIKTGQPQAM